jgi:hypothetical protein
MLFVYPYCSKLDMSYQEYTSNATHSYRNKHTLSSSNTIVCYFCFNYMKPNDITEYTDNGETALCPHCNVNAVIGDHSKLPINDEMFIKHMRYYAFDT